MQIPRGLTIAAAIIVLATLIGIGYMITLPSGPVVVKGSFGSAEITPNADGKNDLTTVSYTIRRPAKLSIYLTDSQGRRYNFRDSETRAPGDYSVLFGGIVDGFTLPGDQIKGQVKERVIPDGVYTWTIEATDLVSGQTDKDTGKLTVADADSQLPDIWDFSISPQTFTPNQDGLDDQVWINVYVPKPATLSVYLVNNTGIRYFVPESNQARNIGEAGRHTYQYDGGVTDGSDPPPDGDYTVVATAQDAIGQIVEQQGKVTIKDGGVPLAEILGQPVGDTVVFNTQTVTLGDVLTFKLTVENTGNAPVRTTGPAPGYVYDQDQLAASTGFLEESGAWRVGLHCDTCLTDYPWRWGLGTPDTLTGIKDQEGRIHYYLMPHQRAVITGGVRLKTIVPSRNPQQFWTGLIHEDVEIAPQNNRVDPHWIDIVVEGALGTPTAQP